MSDPDPELVEKLRAMHIEDPEIVAGILARNGLTLCDEDPTDDGECPD